jgi:hypothetical protein
MHVVNSTEFIDVDTLIEKSIKHRFENKYREQKKDKKKIVPKFVMPTEALKFLGLRSTENNFCLTVKVKFDLETRKIISQSIFPSIIGKVIRIHTESTDFPLQIPNYDQYVSLFGKKK